MTSPSDRLNLALAGRYRIERELGAGGMATVYLAEDLKHDRKVAIKVLKPELAAVLGAERFVVEIKTTASLSHPHILPLFDSGTADGFLFYVMPYIQGETIREKLNRETQFGVDEAVRIAREIADALDYAHRQGVIHRDIKPENILLHDGRAMVMDFGIALAVSAAAGGRMTETGLSLGTPHYMSPEQATAEKEITGRSDQYSLASVLYEMLAGQPPHIGGAAQQVIMKILTAQAEPVTALRKSVPANVDAALVKALEKVPADRFASTKAFADALANATFAATGSVRPAANVRRAIPVGAVAIALVAVAAGWFGRALATREDTPAPIRFATTLGQPGVDHAFISISADGRRIAQSVVDSLGTLRLAVRDLGTNTVTILDGTEGVWDSAEFSVDGEWVYFVAESRLKRVPSRGGPATTLVDSLRLESNGIAVAENGDVYFPVRQSGVWVVRSDGGPPRQLTKVDAARKEFGHWSPQMLPGGRAFIYTNYATPISQSRVEAYDIKSGRTTVLAEGAVFGRYSPSGHLLHARDKAVFAIAFDADALTTSGSAVPVQDDVAWDPTNARAAFAISANGTFAYLRDSEWYADRLLVWRDRTGKDTPAIERPGAYAEPALSPDGRWIVLTVDQTKKDLWLFDVGRKILSQLTRAPAYAFKPVWMPDSRHVLYAYEDGPYQVHAIPIDGSAPDRVVVTSPFDKYPMSVSPDGRRLLMTESVSGDRMSVVSLDSAGAPRAVTDSRLEQRGAVFSPDGKWIAFAEHSTDFRAEIYIRLASGAGGQRVVSAGGGLQPRWTRGGREIVYFGPTGMMSAPVDATTGTAGTPVRLFSLADIVRDAAGRVSGYDVTPAGDRFLMAKRLPRIGALPLVVTLNWRPNMSAAAGAKP